MNFELNKWVYANCALWTTNVSENLEGGLIRFQSSYQKCLNFECDHCGQKCASLLCLKFKNCKRKYHLNCAIEAEALFLRDKTLLCKGCLDAGSVPELSLSQVLKDFQTERRLYIYDSQVQTERENSKKAKATQNINQDKGAPFYLGAFHRFGSLIVMNLSKYDGGANNDPSKGFDEFLVIKRVYDRENNNAKRLIMMLMYQNKKQYHFNAKTLDAEEFSSLFLCRKNKDKIKMELEGKPETTINLVEIFQNNEISQFLLEFYQKAIRIEDLFSFWEVLTEKMYLMNNSILADNVFDFVSRFLGLNSAIIKRWIKGPIDSMQLFKRNCPGLSFFQNFFLKNLEDFNPFEKQLNIEAIYNDLKTDSHFPFEKTDKQISNFNPKNAPLKVCHKPLPMKESKRRKSDVISDFNIKIDELITEPNNPIEGFHILPIKVQSEKELEKKLRQEYASYKKRATKGVYVAPSNIHKYGLFATNQ